MMISPWNVHYNSTLPSFNQILDFRMLVNSAIVHHDHGVRRWVWLHVVE